MIVMNGGAGMKGQMASSSSYLLCFYKTSQHKVQMNMLQVTVRIGWQDITSGVLLGSQQFTIYINDVDGGTKAILNLLLNLLII